MLIIYIFALLGVLGTISVASFMIIIYVGKISKLFVNMILNNFTSKLVSHRDNIQKNIQKTESPKNIKETYYSGINNEGLSGEAISEIKDILDLARRYKIVSIPCYKGYSLFCYDTSLKSKFIKALMLNYGKNIMTHRVNSIDKRITNSVAKVIKSRVFLDSGAGKCIVYFGEFDTIADLDKPNMNYRSVRAMANISTYSGLGRYRFIY